jgi:hypothetical protein
MSPDNLLSGLINLDHAIEVMQFLSPMFCFGHWPSWGLHQGFKSTTDNHPNRFATPGLFAHYA